MQNGQSQLRFWLITLAIFVLLLWVLKPVLLPFAAGMVIAYFLDPAVEALSRRRIPRWLSAVAVLGGFVTIIVLVMMLIIPILRDQVTALMQVAPEYISKIRSHYLPGFENWLGRLSPDLVDQLHSSAGDYMSEIAGVAARSIQRIITSGIAFIDILALAVITPIVAFYMLRDWSALTETVDNQIPRRYYKVVRHELSNINDTLSGFLRGQSLVCIALGSYYALGLTLTGLQYGFSIGVLAGVMSFVPYVGTGFAWVCSIALAIVQFDTFTPIGIVLGVLYVGHLLEAYILAPRLIGHRVGLHPVWIFFALIAGAKLLGFLGLLIAVPTAAVIGVLVRFGFRQYRNSPVYKDQL